MIKFLKSIILKKIILILFLIINISCNHKTISEKIDENHIVSDKEVYSFLSLILKNESKSITECRNENVIGLINENYELKKMLTHKDLIFIKKQIKNDKKFNLNPEYLDGFNVISQKRIKKEFSESKSMCMFWKKFEKNYGTTSLFSISLPIFSLNKKIVIISTELLSKGGFGYNGIVVYLRTKGRWKLYKKYTSSIS